MPTEFCDTKSESQHEAFQLWRRQHQQGFFLTFKTREKANLHEATGCWHQGGYDLSSEQYGGSATSKRKVCSEDAAELLAWAKSNRVNVTPCAHCIAKECMRSINRAIA